MAKTLLDWYKWESPSITYLSRLIDLMRKGYLRESDTSLWVDAHNLLHWNFEHLLRVKKIVNITMRMGLATKIRFNIWNKVGESDNYEMVPQDLFNRHFGRYNITNPHGIQIEYDWINHPSTDEERAKIIEWTILPSMI